MTCAKVRVMCTLITASGARFVGENACGNPQPACPREPGEGYEKCKTICRQAGHAEIVALAHAGRDARGAQAFIEGHTHVCVDCQRALNNAGVKSFTVGSPNPVK